MRLFVKRAVLFLGAIVLLLFITPILLGDKIKSALLEQITNSIETPIEVESTNLSLLRFFPKASIEFNNVAIEGKNKEQLVSAKKIAGTLSYFDLLFSDNFKIETIYIQNGSFNFSRDKKSKGSWDILKKSKKNTKKSEFNLQIKKLVLDNVGIYYNDLATKTNINANIYEGVLSGNFGKDLFNLHGSIDGLSNFVKIDNDNFISNINILSEFNLEVDLKDNLYTFKNSVINFDGMPIDIDGSIGFIKNSTAYNLNLSTTEGKLNPLIKTLPKEWISSNIRDLQSKGRFKIKGLIKGLSDKKQSPKIFFSGNFHDGTLQAPVLDKTIKNVSFDLVYSNGRSKSQATSKLELNKIIFNLGNNKLTSNFSWNNFNNPTFNLDLSGDIPLKYLEKVSQKHQISNLNGLAKIQNFNFRATKKQLTTPSKYDQIKATGKLEFEGLNFKLNNHDLDFSADGITLKNNKFSILKGKLLGNNQEIEIDVTLRNLIPFIFSENPVDLIFDAVVTSDDINLNHWLTYLENHRSDAKQEETSKSSFSINGTFLCKANKTTYDKIVINDLITKGKLNNNLLELNTEAYAMEGVWESNCSIDIGSKKKLKGDFSSSEVDIKDLLSQTNNLWQNTITKDNLNGEMTIRSIVSAEWDENNEFVADKLNVIANLGLIDGHLKDFALLQATSQFIRSSYLEDIAFTNIENWIEIKNGTVYLPAMFVQSSAANFIVTGKHSFDQEVNYGIKINGAQMLMSKLFGKVNASDILPDRRNGFTNIGVNIAGNLNTEDYKIAIRNKEVRKKIRASQVHKQLIKQRLRVIFDEDSLIDGYDEEGNQTKENYALNSNKENKNSSPNNIVFSEIEVDTSENTYLDEESTTIRSQQLKASDRASNPQKKNILEGLFKQQKQNEEEEEDGEYLEGFDDF